MSKPRIRTAIARGSIYRDRKGGWRVRIDADDGERTERLELRVGLARLAELLPVRERLELISELAAGVAVELPTETP